MGDVNRGYYRTREVEKSLKAFWNLRKKVREQGNARDITEEIATTQKKLDSLKVKLQKLQKNEKQLEKLKGKMNHVVRVTIENGGKKVDIYMTDHEAEKADTLTPEQLLSPKSMMAMPSEGGRLPLMDFKHYKRGSKVSIAVQKMFLGEK